MGYNDEGVKALAQFVTPTFEFSERAKVPLNFVFIYLKKKDLMANNRVTTNGMLTNGQMNGQA